MTSLSSSSFFVQPRTTCPLGEAKFSAAISNGGQDVASQAVVTVIFWKIELVEARVCTWQSAGLVVAMDAEPAEAIHTLEFLEAIEWHLAGTRDELQEFGLLFLVE